MKLIHTRHTDRIHSSLNAFHSSVHPAHGLLFFSYLLFLSLRSRIWHSPSRILTRGPRKTCSMCKEWRCSWEAWNPSSNRWRKATSRISPSNTRCVQIHVLIQISVVIPLSMSFSFVRIQSVSFTKRLTRLFNSAPNTGL